MNLYILFYSTKIYALALISIQDSIDPLLLNLDDFDGSKVKELCIAQLVQSSQIQTITSG